MRVVAAVAVLLCLASVSLGDVYDGFGGEVDVALSGLGVDPNTGGAFWYDGAVTPLLQAGDGVWRSAGSPDGSSRATLNLFAPGWRAPGEAGYIFVDTGQNSGAYLGVTFNADGTLSLTGQLVEGYDTLGVLGSAALVSAVSPTAQLILADGVALSDAAVPALVASGTDLTDAAATLAFVLAWDLANVAPTVGVVDVPSELLYSSLLPEVVSEPAFWIVATLGIISTLVALIWLKRSFYHRAV